MCTESLAFRSALTDHAAKDGEHAAKNGATELMSIHIVQFALAVQ